LLFAFTQLITQEKQKDPMALTRNANGSIRFPAMNTFRHIMEALVHPRATNLPPHVQVVYMQVPYIAAVATAAAKR
jgi:hypothetical protein